jgi:hypothetical protein
MKASCCGVKIYGNSTTTFGYHGSESELLALSGALRFAFNSLKKKRNITISVYKDVGEYTVINIFIIYFFAQIEVTIDFEFLYKAVEV